MVLQKRTWTTDSRLHSYALAVLETDQEDLSIYWIATEEVGAGMKI